MQLDRSLECECAHWMLLVVSMRMTQSEIVMRVIPPSMQQAPCTCMWHFTISGCRCNVAQDSKGRTRVQQQEVVHSWRVRGGGTMKA